ncbi:MAG: hypothetical protein ACOC04_05530 [Halothece sp.]
MGNRGIQIVLILFLIFLAIAPFAGLAPLLGILLIAGVSWAVLALVQIALAGNPKGESE